MDAQIRDVINVTKHGLGFELMLSRLPRTIFGFRLNLLP
jgi:hypothetical protein